MVADPISSSVLLLLSILFTIVNPNSSDQVESATETEKSLSGIYEKFSPRDGSATFQVTDVDTNTVHITGEATWGESNNYGEIDTTLPVVNNTAVYIVSPEIDNSCIVHFSFSDQVLNVEVENFETCGDDPLFWGANVTFEGAYKKI